MNKNLFRWMFLGLLSFAAVTFVGCKDDDTQDIQMPTLSVSVTELTFDEAGGRQVVDITSNCNWTVVKPDWVTVTPASGSNNGQIEVAADETTTPRSGKITFELTHPEWGKWGKAEASISLTQTVAGEQPAPETIDEAKYYNFTKVTELQPNKWYAIVGDHNGTMKAGTTQSNNYGYMSAMAVTVANDAFKAMGTAAFYFEADGDNVKIKMTNGKYLYQTGDYDSFQYGTAPENNWKVEAQADGTFKITNNGTSKYVQMDSQYGSYGCYTEEKGTMPYLFALGSEAEPPQENPAITIADLLEMEDGAVPEGTVIEGVVISGELGNLTSLKTVYLQDETAAVQLYFSANTDYKRGDKLKVNLTGAQRAEYNDAQQVSGVVNAQVEVLSQNNEITAKSVSMADFMANKYESQYIAVEGVQVAESELEKTWGNKDNHTSIKIVDAEGNYFYVFSSMYATYKDQAVAQGSGVIKGIASISTNGMQLIFSTEDDWAGLTGERFEEKAVELELEGDGKTVETAYTLADLQTLYNAGQNPTGVWVKGTIAGCYENSGLITDATKYVASNLALQTGEVVVPVALPSKSDLRTALNLQDNPTNLNKEVAIKGDIIAYFSVAGLKNTTEYQFIEGSTEPEPELVASDWVLSGDFNEWGQSTILYVKGDYVVAEGVALTTTDGFKVRTNVADAWTPQYGADSANGTVYYTDMEIPVILKNSDADAEPGNVLVAADGTYDIYFSEANAKLYVMTAGKTPADAKAFEKYSEPVDLTGTAWFLAGSMTDWANGQIAATVEGDYAVVKNVEMAAGAQFKFKAENDWNNSYGTASTLEVGVPTLAYLKGDNCTVAEAGTYDVSLGLKDAKITITKSEAVEPEPEPEVLAVIDATKCYTLQPATEVKGGKWYAFVSGTNAASAISYASYLYTEDTKALTGDQISVPANCLFGLMTVEGGYTIQQYNASYIYKNSTNSKVDYSATLPETNAVWTIADEDADGLYTIKNGDYFFEYSSSYDSYGAYSSSSNTKPALYEMVEVNTEDYFAYFKNNGLNFVADGSEASITIPHYGASALTATTDNAAFTATVDGNTVTVTAAKNETTDTITATLTITAGSASATVALTQAGQPIVGGTVATFDFTTMGYTETTDMTTQTIESNGVTIVFDKGTNSSNTPKYYTTGTAIRFYAGNKMTFSGKTITKIDFTFDASNMANNISMTPGTYTQASDKASGTWEGSATEVTFTTDGTKGNNRIKSIVVTFEE